MSAGNDAPEERPVCVGTSSDNSEDDDDDEDLDRAVIRRRKPERSGSTSSTQSSDDDDYDAAAFEQLQKEIKLLVETYPELGKLRDAIDQDDDLLPRLLDYLQVNHPAIHQRIQDCPQILDYLIMPDD